MKVLSTEGLTKLIQLIKSSFISVDDTVTTNTVTLSTVATSGSFNDLTDRPNAYVVDFFTRSNSWCRVWSDTWVEQGGLLTPSADANAIEISLLKPLFAVNNLLTTAQYTSESGYTANSSNCSNRNATLWACSTGKPYDSNSDGQIDKFVINRGGTSWTINWYVCGYTLDF